MTEKIRKKFLTNHSILVYITLATEVMPFTKGADSGFFYGSTK
jgi:hypothetical protein